MHGFDGLFERIGAELDDVLATVPLVTAEPQLEERLYTQLVDLLVESMFLDLRRRHLCGALSRDAYVEELTELGDRCRAIGLLPLPARRPTA